MLATISRMRERATLVRTAAAVTVAVLFAYAFINGGYFLTVLGFATIYGIFVTGLNLFMGHAGQVSFGQNAFAAVGGYTSAVLTTAHGWPVSAAVLAGVVGAAILALAIGRATLRLRGHYLAMATLALGLITYEISVQWDSVTLGFMGIAAIPPLRVAGWEPSGDRSRLALLLALFGMAAWCARRLTNSRFGDSLDAVAGSEEAALAIGIDVARAKLAVFVIAAAYAGLAGALLVHFVGYVSPEVFGMHMVVLGFTMLYVGGLGTVFGPLIGAVIISLLPETFRSFKEYQDFAYATALIVILIYAPKGLGALAAGIARSRGSNPRDENP